jgi:hypothetical protein
LVIFRVYNCRQKGKGKFQKPERKKTMKEEYTCYKHYILKNHLKDCKESYEKYIRETARGYESEWLIAETVKRTYNYRFIFSDVMI